MEEQCEAPAGGRGKGHGSSQRGDGSGWLGLPWRTVTDPGRMQLRWTPSPTRAGPENRHLLLPQGC